MDLIGAATALSNVTASGGLAVAGLVAFAMAIVRPQTPRALPPLLAFVAGAGLCALAADEGLELHDRVGRRLWSEHGIAAPGPINHVDDVIVLFYLVAGGAVGLASARIVLKTPRFLAGLIAAAGLMAAGAGFDALGTPGTWTEVPEETLESTGAVLAAMVFLLQFRVEGAALRAPALPDTGTPPLEA
jgi:hypothetical protein